MHPIDFFKLQAKNLMRDYKTKTPYVDKVDGYTYYNYTPKFFDVDRIMLEFDWNEEKFTLMQAQHTIALMVGFRKWGDLIKASETELELAKLLFDHQDKIGYEDWEHFMAHTIELNNNKNFDLETWVEIFKEVFVVKGESHHSDFEDYRIIPVPQRVSNEAPRPAPKRPEGPKITSLPLSKEDHAEFVETANSVFESVIERIEPNNPAMTRKLWDADDYVNTMLTDDMLPISKDYALSLIDAFLVHHVIGLAVEADKKAS